MAWLVSPLHDILGDSHRLFGLLGVEDRVGLVRSGLCQASVDLVRRAQAACLALHPRGAMAWICGWRLGARHFGARTCGCHGWARLLGATNRRDRQKARPGSTISHLQTKIKTKIKIETNKKYRPRSATSPRPCLSGRPRSDEDKGSAKDQQDKETGTDEEPIQIQKMNISIKAMVKTEAEIKHIDRDEDNGIG